LDNRPRYGGFVVDFNGFQHDLRAFQHDLAPFQQKSASFQGVKTIVKCVFPGVFAFSGGGYTPSFLERAVCPGNTVTFGPLDHRYPP
jgi:hypothetical protein